MKPALHNHPLHPDFFWGVQRGSCKTSECIFLGNMLDPAVLHYNLIFILKPCVQNENPSEHLLCMIRDSIFLGKEALTWTHSGPVTNRLYDLGQGAQCLWTPVFSGVK